MPQQQQPQQQEQRQSFNEAARAERIALSCGIMALEEEILRSQGGAEDALVGRKQSCNETEEKGRRSPLTLFSVQFLLKPTEQETLNSIQRQVM